MTQPDTDVSFSEEYPEGHARIVEALHRYNVGPDWTRAECVDLVRTVERLRADLKAATYCVHCGEPLNRCECER